MYNATGKNLPVAGAFVDKRADVREEVFLRTNIFWPRDNSAPAELVDISQSGFLIRTRPEFRKLDRLRIALPLVGEQPAEVAWALAGCVGCRFVYTIGDHDFVLLLKAIRKESRPRWSN